MESTLTSCVNQLGDSEAHQDKFRGDCKEWLGFQEFGPQYNLGVSCPIHLGGNSLLESKSSLSSHPDQSVSWGGGGKGVLSVQG